MSCGLSRSSSSTIGESGDLLEAIEIGKQRVKPPLRQKVGSYGSALIEARVELHIHYDRVDALASAFATICRDLDRFTRSDAPTLIAWIAEIRASHVFGTPARFRSLCPTPGLPEAGPFPPEDRPPPFTEVDDGVTLT